MRGGLQRVVVTEGAMPKRGCTQDGLHKRDTNQPKDMETACWVVGEVQKAPHEVLPPPPEVAHRVLPAQHDVVPFCRGGTDP